MDKRISFSQYLLKRINEDQVGLFSNFAVQKAYYTGAYAQAVIQQSYHSEISNKNTTFKNWLSSQIINFRNLDKIFAKAFSFEQKLKLKIRNDSEIRKLAHEVPAVSPTGIPQERITFAFICGFDDYKKFIMEHPSKYEHKGDNNE